MTDHHPGDLVTRSLRSGGVQRILPARMRAAAAIRAAERNDWESVVALSEGLGPRYGRSAVYGVLAYLHLGQRAEAVSRAMACVQAGLEPGTLINIAARLADHGAVEGAADVLIACGQAGNWPSNGSQVAYRVLRDISEPKRTELARLIREHTGERPDADAAESAAELVVRLQRAAPASYVRDDREARFVVAGRSRELEAAQAQIGAMRSEFLQRLTVPPNDSVLCFRDVFVNALCQIWTADGRAVDSRQKPLPDPAMCRQGLADGSIPTVGHATHPDMGTKGIYHWLVEHASRVSWLLDHPMPEVKVLLPGDAAPLRQQSLELYGIDPGQILRYDAPMVFCRHLYLPHSSATGNSALRQLWKVFQNARDAALRLHGPIGPEKLLISRRDSNRRVLTNQLEFEAAFERIGYRSMVFAGMTLSQQIATVASARRIVGPHGAGLSHLVFAHPEARLGELMPYQRGSMNLRMCFARVAMSRRLDHAMWLEDINPVTREWQVDVAGAFEFLRAALE